MKCGLELFLGTWKHFLPWFERADIIPYVWVALYVRIRIFMLSLAWNTILISTSFSITHLLASAESNLTTLCDTWADSRDTLMMISVKQSIILSCRFYEKTSVRSTMQAFKLMYYFLIVYIIYQNKPNFDDLLKGILSFKKFVSNFWRELVREVCGFLNMIDCFV